MTYEGHHKHALVDSLIEETLKFDHLSYLLNPRGFPGRAGPRGLPSSLAALAQPHLILEGAHLADALFGPLSVSPSARFEKHQGRSGVFHHSFLKLLVASLLLVVRPGAPSSDALVPCSVLSHLLLEGLNLMVLLPKLILTLPKLMVLHVDLLELVAPETHEMQHVISQCPLVAHMNQIPSIASERIRKQGPKKATNIRDGELTELIPELRLLILLGKLCLHKQATSKFRSVAIE